MTYSKDQIDKARNCRTEVSFDHSDKTELKITYWKGNKKGYTLDISEDSRRGWNEMLNKPLL